MIWAEWFYGKDLIIDIFSGLVLLFILLFTVRYYVLSEKKRKYLLLITSFILLTISFVFEILSHMIIYRTTQESHHIGIITVVHETITSAGPLVFFGLFSQRLFFIFGLYLLFLVYVDHQAKSSLVLTSVLLFLMVFTSQYFHHLFHISALVLLAIIAFSQFMDYLSSRFYKTLLLSISFAIIAISFIFAIFIGVSPSFYIISETIQLVGFVLLLVTFVLVRSHGKKTRSH